jgi:hypothetical protein
MKQLFVVKGAMLAAFQPHYDVLLNHGSLSLMSAKKKLMTQQINILSQ